MDRPTHATLETDSDGFTRREFLSAMLSTSLLAYFRARRSELFCLQGVAISFRHYVAGSCQVLTGFMTSAGICSVA